MIIQESHKILGLLRSDVSGIVIALGILISNYTEEDIFDLFRIYGEPATEEGRYIEFFRFKWYLVSNASDGNYRVIKYLGSDNLPHYIYCGSYVCIMEKIWTDCITDDKIIDLTQKYCYE